MPSPSKTLEGRQAYRERNRERIRMKQAEYDRKRIRTPEARKREWLKAQYALTLGQVMEMAEAQNYICPLCKRVFGQSEMLKRNGNQLVVDHDHGTDKVRGLLCRACNILLGRFGDKVENIEVFLSRVRAYLERA